MYAGNGGQRPKSEKKDIHDIETVVLRAHCALTTHLNVCLKWGTKAQE